MTKTTLNIDHEAMAMVISPVFTCSLAPGEHSAQGAVGEHMNLILGRWLATNYRQLTVVRVLQTSLKTWSAILDNGNSVEFSLII